MPQQPKSSSISVVPASDVNTGTQHTTISRFLDASGDGTGSKNANGDYTASNATFTADAGTDQLTATGHGLATGDGPLRVTSSGTLPAGLAADTDYYAILVDANTIQLATSVTNANASTAVDIADAGTGTHTLHVYTRFYIQPGTGEAFRLSRMLFSMRDTNGFSAAEYGNLGLALSRGIEIRVAGDDGVLADLTDGVALTVNADWGRFCFDADIKTWGAGDEFLLARWTFLKSGQYIRLDGDSNQRLEVIMNDDLSGLVDHRFLVQGYEE